MAEERKKELKHEDIREFLGLFSPEFNDSNLHDRILVFHVETCDAINANVDNKEDKEPEIKRHKPSESDMEFPVAGSECINLTISTIEDMAEKNEQSTITDEESSKEECEIAPVINLPSPTSAKMIDQDEKQENTVIVVTNVGDKTCAETIIPCSDTKEHDSVHNEQNNNTCEHKLFVHSCWLAVQSSYFRALFYSSGMKEASSKEVVMKVNEDEVEAHLILIEAMYTIDILDNKDYTLVSHVLVLADKYDVNLVFKKCKYVLMATPQTLQSCEFILERIKNFSNCNELLEIIKDYLVKKFSPLDKTWTERSFIQLSGAAMGLLLSSDKLAVQSENTVFVALMKWMKSKHLSEFTKSSLLCLVRFDVMSLGFLYDVVKNHDLATTIKGFHDMLQYGLAYHGFSERRREELKLKQVPRMLFDDSNNSTFIWVIDKNEREKLLNRGAILSMFWYKGYQLYVCIKYNTQSKKYGFSLGINNISNDAFIHLEWSVKSKLIHRFCFRETNYNKFTNRSCGGWPSLNGVKLESIANKESHTMEVWVKIVAT